MAAGFGREAGEELVQRSYRRGTRRTREASLNAQGYMLAPSPPHACWRGGTGPAHKEMPTKSAGVSVRLSGCEGRKAAASSSTFQRLLGVDLACTWRTQRSGYIVCGGMVCMDG